MNVLPLRLAAVTSHPRHALVAQLVAVLNSLGAVLDSHPFSNLALTVHFELSPSQVPNCRASLLALPLSFSETSLEALRALENIPCADLPPEIMGSLNITFVHHEPDLRMVIPAVPG